MLARWVGAGRSGRGRHGGGFAWISPWELSQPGGKEELLWHSPAVMTGTSPPARLLVCRAQPPPQRAPERGQERGKATRGLVRLKHKLLPQLPGKNLITN